MTTRRQGRAEATALVIVHLSSIMHYVDWYGLGAGQRFAAALMAGIDTHPGPVVIMDQEERRYMDEGAGVRYDRIKHTCEARDQVTWFHHDELEDPNPWTDGMDTLARLLRRLDARTVLIGGLWLGKTSGCVRYTRQSLTWRRVSAHIVEHLCAFEENDRRAMVS